MNPPSHDWIDQVAARVTSSYEAFAQELQAADGRLLWVVSSYRTQVFPLRIFLSLRANDDQDVEDVVVCLDCQMKSDGLVAQIDICLDDGSEILALGPDMDLSDMSEPAIAEHIGAGVDALLREAHALVLAHL